MVRSHWIGPVFGVLALTGFALGQSATPLVPVLAGDAGEQIVTVQELGKPALKCKILKKWIEPDGTHGYEVQALETGEVLTIEDAPASAPASAHGGPLRAIAMRIFHSGRHGETMPPGMPVPPPDAVVVAQPFVNLPPPPSIAAAPTAMPTMPAQTWPAPSRSPRATVPAPVPPRLSRKSRRLRTCPAPRSATPAAVCPSASGQALKGEKCDACQCGPAVGTRMEPVPSGPAVVGPTQTWPFKAGIPAVADANKSCQCAPPVVTKVQPVPSGRHRRQPDADVADHRRTRGDGGRGQTLSVWAAG